MPINRKLNRQTLVKIIAVLILIIGVSTALGMYSSKRKTTPSTKTQNATAVAEAIPQPLPTFEDFGLTIEKLNVSAPIIPNVDGFNEKVYYAALAKGVAQFKGSVTPDQPGNLFIFGHSSFFEKAVGDYKEVFKNLDQLKENDEFLVYYHKTPYRYKVTKSFETNDKDWSIINQDNKTDKSVTLMTCWPPGTIAKRWVVQAKQI